MEILALFTKYLAAAGAITCDDGVFITDWETADQTGEPDNQVLALFMDAVSQKVVSRQARSIRKANSSTEAQTLFVSLADAMLDRVSLFRNGQSAAR